MPKRKRGCVGILAALVCLSLILYVSRDWALARLGHSLVDSEQPVKSDAIVVLGGDGSLSRLLRAEQLFREGFAPIVVVSGPRVMFGIPECELGIAAAAKRGYSTQSMHCAPNDSRSTVEEAQALKPELKRMGVKRVLIVTSNYHTRRTRKVWRAETPDLEVHVVAATDPYFDPDDWWKSREGQKVLFLEWSKTFAYVFGF